MFEDWAEHLNLAQADTSSKSVKRALRVSSMHICSELLIEIDRPRMLNCVWAPELSMLMTSGYYCTRIADNLTSDGRMVSKNFTQLYIVIDDRLLYSLMRAFSRLRFAISHSCWRTHSPNWSNRASNIIVECELSSSHCIVSPPLSHHVFSSVPAMGRVEQNRRCKRGNCARLYHERCWLYAIT